MRNFVPTLITSVLMTVSAGLCAADSQDSVNTHGVAVPRTVSPQWQAWFETQPDPAEIPAFPLVADIAGWLELQSAFETDARMDAEAVIDRYRPTIVEREFGGVPVLDIRPQKWVDDGFLAIHVHGGAFVLGSVYSTVSSSVLFAVTTGLRVVSIDYPLAPHADWRQILDAVVAVFAGLQEQGVPARRIVIYGESAGGAIAAGVVLRLRDSGRDMPAAAILWSPWSDITETGDTYQTLKDAETSYRYELHLHPAAEAYARPSDQRNPYVSPVYGEYDAGFPPTLIQGGTREIFLSNFVRHYQALDDAGVQVKLDLYEGMPHVFQIVLPDSPESKRALAKVNSFIAEQLGR